MALTSHTGSSHSIYLVAIQRKTKHNGVNSFINMMASARTKEIPFRLFSPSRSSLKMTEIWTSDGTKVGQRSGHLVIVAASPPTEDTEDAVVIATEPLTKEDLVGHLVSGCKPEEKWRFKF